MKNYKKNLCLISVLTLFFTLGEIPRAWAEAKIDITAIAEKIPVATNKDERRLYIADLQKQYDDTKQILLQNLYNAQAQFQDNNTFFSPLHVAIISVGIWKISDAEDTLLDIIDYTINPASLPVGINVSGDFFYPTIRVLVDLRVNNDKVISAIANARANKQIYLLTWVLNERQGDNFPKTITLLTNASEKYNKQTEKGNLATAIKLLNKVKSSSDLIPRIEIGAIQ